MPYSIPAPPKPTTQKERRKAAAADANDRAIFTRTQYGRMRIPPLHVRVVVALALAVAFPGILIYRAVRRMKSPKRA